MFAWRDNYISYNGGSAVVNDAYWNNVGLLLNYETPQTAFTDGSTTNALITVGAGNPRPNLRTPFTGTGASMYFSGAASTFLSAPANAAYAFGTGDFTVELWYYRTVTSSAAALVGAWSGTASTSAWLLTQGQSNTANIRWGGSDGTTTAFVESTACIVNNTWGHIAVSRSSGVLKMFYNGTQVYSAANTTNLSNSSTSLQVMAVASSFLSTGFISNVRIVKGTAVYTAAFTPPTSPLTAISGTSFLLTCTNQGTQNSLVVLDQSTSALAPIPTNSPTFSGLSPFFTTPPNTYPGSIKLNGTNQYLLSSAAGGVPQGTGAYTVEGWVRFNAIVANVGQTWAEGNLAANGGYFIGLGISYNGSNNGFRIGKASISDNEYCNFTFSLNTWYHIAQVRSGTTIYFFVNGVQQTTQTGSGGSTGSYSWPVNTSSRWGASLVAGSAAQFANGWLSNWRVVNGTALYTSNFTPSTTPLTAITNTVMLMSHQTTGLYDVSNNGSPLTSSQTTQTSVYKYGTQGGLNTTGITTVTDAINLQFNADPFTIEGWIYRNSSGVVGGIISKGTSTTGWRVRVNASNQLVFAVTAADVKTSTTTIAATTWTYFAWTRTGSTNYMFINGTQEGSTFSDSTSFNQTNNMLVGSDGVNTTLQGYMDEVRLTKGVARYTASFTAPTTAFPTLGGTGTVEYLVVGGGGGGGGFTGAGGGAGGVLTGTLSNIAAFAYPVVVGPGGAGGTGANQGTNGTASSFSSILAAGGGGGGTNSNGGLANKQNGVAGGSGGGSSLDNAAGTVGAGNTPTTSPSQGNNGGLVYTPWGGGGTGVYATGGGGGASAVGGAATTVKGGDGGAGVSSSISGTAVTYGGGGGGGVFKVSGTSDIGGAGGAGGGGKGYGGSTTGQGATSGTPNTGGGGGGQGQNLATIAGSGGYGIVIIRYLTDGSNGISSSSTGGTKTTSGSYTIHTFLTSDTFTAVLT